MSITSPLLAVIRIIGAHILNFGRLTSNKTDEIIRKGDNLFGDMTRYFFVTGLTPQRRGRRRGDGVLNDLVEGLRRR